MSEILGEFLVKSLMYCFGERNETSRNLLYVCEAASAMRSSQKDDTADVV